MTSSASDEQMTATLHAEIRKPVDDPNDRNGNDGAPGWLEKAACPAYFKGTEGQALRRRSREGFAFCSTHQTSQPQTNPHQLAEPPQESERDAGDLTISERGD